MAKDDLSTYAENTWCKGCGNFAILNAFKKAVRNLEKKGISRDKIIISSGIGCHAKIFDYLKLNGIYSIHGRSMTTIQGIKLANPDLKTVTFAGDGDAYGEGLAHMIFAAKRNADITVIVHDNAVYGLTTGQFTPTSKKGFKGRSTPHGSVEEPINPLVLMLEAGATYVARGYSGKLQHLAKIIEKGIEHNGFSFIEVLQPCVSFNNTYQLYNDLVSIIDDELYETKEILNNKDPESSRPSFDEALKIARDFDKLSLGILYQIEKPTFHQELYGDWNPVTKKISKARRREQVKRLVNP
jgi:2-oxoglutarate ferredoxin oxidoreductase subunit beta